VLDTPCISTSSERRLSKCKAHRRPMATEARRTSRVNRVKGMHGMHSDQHFGIPGMHRPNSCHVAEWHAGVRDRAGAAGGVAEQLRRMGGRVPSDGAAGLPGGHLAAGPRVPGQQPRGRQVRVLTSACTPRERGNYQTSPRGHASDDTCSKPMCFRDRVGRLRLRRLLGADAAAAKTAAVDKR